MSELGALNKLDWWKGLVLAALTTPITVVYQSINAGSLILDWPSVGKVALAGALGYLIKNVFTGSGGQLLTNSLLQTEDKKQ